MNPQDNINNQYMNNTNYQPPYNIGYQQPYNDYRQNGAYPPPYMQNQGYYPNYPPPPPPPRYVPTLVQENGIPVYPRQEEKKWIRKFYNWVGGTLLIHTGLSLLIIILISVIFVLVMFGTGEINIFKDIDSISGKNEILLYAILGAIAYPIANVVCTFIGSSATKMKIKPLFNISNCSAAMIIVAIVIALGVQSSVMYVGGFLATILENIGFDIYGALEDVPDVVGVVPNILDCIGTCILAPITEELLFRGFVLKNLSRFNLKFGIFASALLFGLMHGNIPQFLLAFPIGIVLAYITVKSSSIIPAMIVHIVVNSVASLQSFITDPDLQMLIITIWDIVFVIAAITLLIVLGVKKKINFPKTDIAKKKRGWPLFFSSATCIIIFIVYIVEIISLS